LWDAEGLVKLIGDGGLFSHVVIARSVSLVITVKSPVGGGGGMFMPAEQGL